MTHHPAITISRTLGSGGTKVGFLVARQLGWHFCDRSILRKVAKDLGLSVHSLRYQEEHPCGFLERLQNLLVFTSLEVPFAPPVDLPIYSSELFEAERNVMLHLAESAPAVLVGRGGFVALKDRPLTLHVRVQADLSFRMQFLVEHKKAQDLEEARQMIETSDRERAAFIRKISGLDWHDSRHFQLVLDTSKDGLEACAERIVEEAKRSLC